MRGDIGTGNVRGPERHLTTDPPPTARPRPGPYGERMPTAVPGERADTMPHRLIGQAMSRDVVAVRRGTPLKQAAALLSAHRISGMPVVDADDRVVGVLSRSDLAPWQEERAHRADRPWRRLSRQLSRRLRGAVSGLEARRADARTAGGLMSAPAIAVGPRRNVVEATRLMALYGVARLPVVDEEGRLTGIVSRTDLLSVFRRPDDAIRAEIEREVLSQALWLAPERVAAIVLDGVVTLSGIVPRRSDIPIALRLTERVDGVVDTVDLLDFDEDDTYYRPAEPPRTGIADGWPHRF